MLEDAGLGPGLVPAGVLHARVGSTGRVGAGVSGVAGLRGGGAAGIAICGVSFTGADAGGGSMGIAHGLGAAAFDTRYHMSAWKSGSAASRIASILKRAGASLVLSPESFFVAEREGPLEEGELERAAQWAEQVFEQFEASRSIQKGKTEFVSAEES